MRIRYSGPDEARDLLIPGGVITCPQGQAVDIYAALDAAHIDRAHAVGVLAGLDGQPDWEVDVASASPEKHRTKAKATPHLPATPAKESTE